MNYLKLYLEMLKAHLKTLLEYKTDFVVDIATQIARSILGVVFIWVLFQNIASINGWTFGEMLFLSGFSQLVFGLFNTFFILWNLEFLVTRGEFDKILIKPANALFQLVTNELDIEHAGDIILALIIISISSQMISLSWNMTTIAMLIFFSISGVVILFSLALITSSLSFWFGRSNTLTEVIYHLTGFTKYPLEIYNTFITFAVSFVVPFAFVNYYPAQLFVGKGITPSFAYLTPVVAIITFAIAYNVWKLGLKNYQSTGS
ncbi:MAG: ABC-2 family transporter protein [Candidatus Aenigmatarchaeota archaeon]